MTLTMHAFRNQSDLLAMQSLLRTFPSRFDSYPTADDLTETLIPDADNTVVWRSAEGDVAGFAVVSPYLNLHHHFQPGALTTAIEDELMDWAVARVRAVAQDQQEMVLGAHACDEDTAKTTFLTRHGFVPSADVVLTMHHPLDDSIPEPALPAGWTLRPLRGASEIAAYVVAHQAAYGTQKMTAELRSSILDNPRYRPDLDLVAISPDGTLVAFCVCSIDDLLNQQTGRKEGEIGIVGTRPEFRGQGLGRAMVLAGLRALKAQGMDTATLSVGNWNTAALGLYQALGFRTVAQQRSYDKQIV